MNDPIVVALIVILWMAWLIVVLLVGGKRNGK